MKIDYPFQKAHRLIWSKNTPFQTNQLELSFMAVLQHYGGVRIIFPKPEYLKSSSSQDSAHSDRLYVSELQQDRMGAGLFQDVIKTVHRTTI